MSEARLESSRIKRLQSPSFGRKKEGEREKVINDNSLSLSSGAIKNLITNRIDNTRGLRVNEPRTSFHGIRYQYFSSSWLEILILPDRGKLRPVHFRGARSLRRFPPPHFNYKLSRSDRAGWIFKKLRGKGGVLFESSQRGRIDVVYIRSTVENLWSEKKKNLVPRKSGRGRLYIQRDLSRGRVSNVSSC